MSIELIIGPMFSGKTTEMLRRLNRHKLGNKKILVVKYDKDDRYCKNAICTHDNIKNDKSYYIINTDNLDSVSELLEKKFVDVIGIDEGQFFENIDVYCDLWANFHNKKIIIAALNGDYKRKMFENITELLPKCENITKLTSICKCGEEASFTHRKNKEQKQEIIGGKDIYEPLCRICFFKFNFNIDK